MRPGESGGFRLGLARIPRGVRLKAPGGRRSLARSGEEPVRSCGLGFRSSKGTGGGARPRREAFSASSSSGPFPTVLIGGPFLSLGSSSSLGLGACHIRRCAFRRPDCYPPWWRWRLIGLEVAGIQQGLIQLRGGLLLL